MVSGTRSALGSADHPFVGSKKPCRAVTVEPTPTPSVSAVDGDTTISAVVAKQRPLTMRMCRQTSSR
jgi:hypothetical protein